MDLRQILKYLRESGKHTRKEIAEIFEISPKTIESYEYGRSSPNNSYIQSLLMFTGYSNDLMFPIHDGSLDEKTINKNKLCKFSHSVNVLKLFTDKKLHDILNFLAVYKGIEIHRISANKEIDNILETYEDAYWIDENHQNLEETKIEEIESSTLKKSLIEEAIKFISALDLFKPSEFGITINDCIDVNCSDEEIAFVANLEKTGFLLTKENILEFRVFSNSHAEYNKKDYPARVNLAHKIGKAFNDKLLEVSPKESRELWSLWQYAPQPVKDKIIALLEKYKADADSLDELV